MKVSLSWLKKYMPVDLEPSRIAEKLTMAGLEVESVESRFDYLENVVVGRVEKVQKHPGADKLTCCTVDTGNGKAEVVCGAPNVREGLNVPCALPGAILPGGMKIKKSKIRGEKSEGMLCSARELRVDADAAGIMTLDETLVPGTPLSDALDLTDWVFEIDLTPNRPDCLSIIGVAREVGAFPEVGRKVRYPDFSLQADIKGDFSITDFARVDIADARLCPRYSAGLLFDVKVGPSPFWLQQRLESVGLSPVNNIVDITNFVMLETGQPLHAFDFGFLAEHRIEVRTAGSEIVFDTLDGKAHRLDPDTLMICDGEKPVGIAGVMGGLNSEISADTTKVLVESACFDPVSIRKTAKRTGINSDASHRFARGVDPGGTANALKRAVTLMAQIAGGISAKDLADEYPGKQEAVRIDLDTRFLNRRLGTDLSDAAIKKLLESVEFDADSKEDRRLAVSVPSFRVDVSRPEDLYEEVARLWGYNNIATRFPRVEARRDKLDPRLCLRERLRSLMTGFGFSEAIHYNFVPVWACDNLLLADSDEKRRVERIMNPISEDMAVLRSSLIPGLLDSVKRNNARQTETLRLFETGNTFLATRPGELPEEKEFVAALWTGDRYPGSLHFKKTPCDFFDIKGVVEGILNGLKVGDIVFEKADRDKYPYYAPGYAASVRKGDVEIGSLGGINSDVLKNFGVKQAVFTFEMDVEKLLGLLPESVSAEPLPRYPAVSRDITLIVDSDVEAGRVARELDSLVANEKVAERAFLFDVYEGDPIEEGKKSFSFRVVYRSMDKTLKEKMVKGLHRKISDALIQKFDADLPE